MSEVSKKVYLYHCMPLSSVSFGVLKPDPAFSDVDFLPAYRWAEKALGYFPLFLAAGAEDAVSMTGYSNQWQKVIGTERRGDAIVNVLRRKGEFPNSVLFVFESESVGSVCSDYMAWHIILNETMNGGTPGKQAERMVFKRSWARSRWYREALRGKVELQLLAPELDLRKSVQVWVRNQKTRRRLLQLGFQNVLVKRLPVNLNR